MKLEQLEVSGPTGLDSVGHSHPLEKAQEMDGKESPIMFTVSNLLSSERPHWFYMGGRLYR